MNRYYMLSLKSKLWLFKPLEIQRTDNTGWVRQCLCVWEREREKRERARERDREKTDKQRVEEKLCILILNRHELELPFLTIPRPLKCQSFPLYIYIYIYTMLLYQRFFSIPLLPYFLLTVTNDRDFGIHISTYLPFEPMPNKSWS